MFFIIIRFQFHSFVFITLPSSVFASVPSASAALPPFPRRCDFTFLISKSQRTNLIRGKVDSYARERRNSRHDFILSDSVIRKSPTAFLSLTYSSIHSNVFLKAHSALSYYLIFAYLTPLFSHVIFLLFELDDLSSSRRVHII